LPQAPQFGLDFKSVHAPLQTAVVQQMYLPHAPPRRLVFPLHARQAVRH
jgi:hypothetical protein